MLLLFEDGEVDMGIVHVPCGSGVVLYACCMRQGCGRFVVNEKDAPIEIV